MGHQFRRSLENCVFLFSLVSFFFFGFFGVLCVYGFRVVGVCKGCTVFVSPNCNWCVWERVKHAKKRTPRVARSAN